MDASTLSEAARELGLDAIGAAPAEPYEETERIMRERRAEGLFADMHFTMARPEQSCHPERLFEGARSVVSAALVYWVPGRRPGRGEGRIARHAWRDHYADLRARLDALGRRLGGSYRVLVDANQHVDREAAERAGIGFYGKNTLLIAPRLGSWIVLGTLVTSAEIESGTPMRRCCGSCRLCLEACPTGAFPDAGVLDARRCISYWTQSRGPVPEHVRVRIDSMVYGCDICQEVCPWNRGVEKRRAAGTEPVGARAEPEPVVALENWLTASDEELSSRYERLYVPRRAVRYLRRNAIAALAASGGSEHEPLLERYAQSDDDLLAEQARWTLSQLHERR